MLGQTPRRASGHDDADAHQWLRVTAPRDEVSDRSLIEHLARGDVGFACPQAILGVGVGEELEGGFDRLEVLGGDEHHVLAPVLGDPNPLVGGRHLLGDLGEPGLDLR